MNAFTDHESDTTAVGRALTPQSGLRAEMDRMAPEIAKALPPHISADRFQRVAMTAIQSNPDLLEADRRSLWAACVKAAQDGLLPDGREGALVTFFDRRRGRLMAQWMPMVAGILKKVRNSGELASITANVVYDGERFRVVLGDEERIEHERDLDAVGRKDPVAVYAIATLRSGEKVREVMTWGQVEDVRSVSRAPERGPWSSWAEEMARKTVIRRLAKRLPMSTDREPDEDLRRVIERVDEQYDFRRKAGASADPVEAVVAARLGDEVPAEEFVQPTVAANAPAAALAAPATAPAALGVSYVGVDGKVHESPDVEAWRGDWLRRVRALVGAGRAGDLRKAFDRNEAAIAAVAEVAPLTAEAVVERVREALSEAEAEEQARARAEEPTGWDWPGDAPGGDGPDGREAA